MSVTELANTSRAPVECLRRFAGLLITGSKNAVRRYSWKCSCEIKLTTGDVLGVVLRVRYEYSLLESLKLETAVEAVVEAVVKTDSVSSASSSSRQSINSSKALLASPTLYRPMWFRLSNRERVMTRRVASSIERAARC